MSAPGPIPRKRQKPSGSTRPASPPPCYEITPQPTHCRKHSIDAVLQTSYLHRHRHHLDHLRRSNTFKHTPDCPSLHHDPTYCHCDRILPTPRFFPDLHALIPPAQHLASSPYDILHQIHTCLRNKLPVGLDGDAVVELAAAFALILRRASHDKHGERVHPVGRRDEVTHVLNMVQRDCGRVKYPDADLMALVAEFVREERLGATLHTGGGLARYIAAFLTSGDDQVGALVDSAVARYVKYVEPVDGFHRHKYSRVKIVGTRGNGYVSSHGTEYVPAMYTCHGVFLNRAPESLGGETFDLREEERVEFYRAFSWSDVECVCVECALEVEQVGEAQKGDACSGACRGLRLWRYVQTFMRCPLDHTVGNPVYFEKEGLAAMEMMECGVSEEGLRVLLGIQVEEVSVFDIAKVFRLHWKSVGIGGLWPLAKGESGVTLIGKEEGISVRKTLERASRIRIGTKGHVCSAIIGEEERWANGESKRWTKEREKGTWPTGGWTRGAVLFDVLE